MKIVHITPKPPYRGGVETLVGDLCKSLAELGNSVAIYCLNRLQASPTRAVVRGNILVKEFKPVIEDPLYVPTHSMITELRNEEADILHIHNIHTLLPLIISLFKYPTAKMVLQPHYHVRPQRSVRTPFFSLYKRFLNYFLIRRFSTVILNSEHEEDAFRRDFPNLHGRMRLVPEEYSIVLPSNLTWNPVKQPRTILYVGALVKYKNVDIVIKAFRILTAQRKNLRLEIVGDGPEKENLLKLATNLGVNEKIAWKSSLPSVFEEYAKASAVVLLSEFESFSRVAHEAISVGTPLIAYNYGTLRKLVEMGQAKGVDSLDPVDVADALNCVLENEWRASKSKRLSGEESYARLIMKVYEELLKR